MEPAQGTTVLINPVSNVVTQTHSSPANSSQTNAGAVYLLSLNSKLSRKKMQYYLQKVAFIMTGKADILACPWGELRRHHIQAMMNILIEGNRSPATMNTYLSALKGVAQEACILEQISTEHYQHIKQIKGIRGDRSSYQR